MQRMKNSGYNKIFGSDLHDYNKILEADIQGSKPIYRSKEWKSAARWMDKRKKKTNWLGPFYKSCIFVPPTPGGELKKRMQLKEKELRAGGRKDYPIKIIETAGRPLERAPVNSDSCNGNKCYDKKCLVQSNTNNKINCRRNSVCYQMTCKICLEDGMLEDKSSCYFGETKKKHALQKQRICK